MKARIQAHRTYRDGLGRAFDATEFFRTTNSEPGRALGSRHAVAFSGRIQPNGI